MPFPIQQKVKHANNRASHKAPSEANSFLLEELSPKELLKESYDIIKGLELNKTIFRSNHASNHLPLEGVFPKDKDMLLESIKSGIGGEIMLKPEILRGL